MQIYSKYGCLRKMIIQVNYQSLLTKKETYLTNYAKDVLTFSNRKSCFNGALESNRLIVFGRGIGGAYGG